VKVANKPEYTLRVAFASDAREAQLVTDEPENNAYHFIDTVDLVDSEGCMLIAVVNVSSDIVEFTAGAVVADVSYIDESLTPEPMEEKVMLAQDTSGTLLESDWPNTSHLDKEQVSLLKNANKDWPWDVLAAIYKHIEMCPPEQIQEQVEHHNPELSKTFPAPRIKKPNAIACAAPLTPPAPSEPGCVVALIHDKEERRRILEGTDGKLPSPQGYDLQDPAVKETDTREWWEHIDLKHLSPTRQTKILRLVKNYKDAFAKSPYEIGTFRYFKARLPEKPDAKPSCDRQFNMNPEQQDAARTAIDQMIQIGCVKPSQSHYAANLVMVKRILNDGKIKYRAAFDARRLNGGLLASRWPNLRAEECFARLAMSHFRSFLDLRWAFWSIVLHEKDQHKTAFYGVNSLLEHTRLPFGIAGAPSIFFLCIFLVVAGMQDVFVNFADDLACLTPLVKGKPEEYSFDLHILHLECLFRRIIHAGFKFSPEKCHFACTPEMQVDWLGHTLFDLYTKPQESKIDKVKNYPVPTTTNKTLGFTSLASFYRTYVPAFAVIARPMYVAIKNREFNWTPAAQKGFEYMKELLCSYPILRQADPRRPYQMYCDASGFAMAGVLEQVDDEGKAYVVAGIRSEELFNTRQGIAKHCLLCDILVTVYCWKPCQGLQRL
jgi:hypothetical protein